MTYYCEERRFKLFTTVFTDTHNIFSIIRVLKFQCIVHLQFHRYAKYKMKNYGGMKTWLAADAI